LAPLLRDAERIRGWGNISLMPAAPTPTTSGHTPGDDADYLLDEPFALIAEEVRELASASQGEFRSPQPLSSVR